MAFIDYYKVLGIEKSATPKDIKNAYRKLARKYHPDLNTNSKDAKTKFQEINEANDVLSDPVKRKKFDQYGKDWQHAEEFENANRQQQQSSSRGGRYSQNQTEDDYSSFFESMFGKSAGSDWNRQVKYKGEDYNTELQLNLIDAFKTHQQILTVNSKKIRITIPSGIKNGQIIKLSGQGGQGANGGPKGDLYIRFAIANHPKFKRIDDNLHTSVDLDLYIAILGGEIIMDTLIGKVKLKVQPETQNLSIVKLTSKGFPIYKKEGKFGNLYVTYTIKIPTNLSEKQKALFLELSQS